MPNASSGFAIALHADGPAHNCADRSNLYAWLIGDWDADVSAYSAEGGRHRGQGEIHAGWILEGRAIQDVWMIPRRADRSPDAPVMPVAGNWYGTTLRSYDPALDAWRIYWIDPATNSFRYQVGRKRGRDIVQEGRTESGTLSRWSFTEIARDSFHWLGESSNDDGATWRLVVEVEARRVRRGTPKE
ncbi:MAG TPA: hypothetical protein VFM11_14825 [Burkholderiales bacterium]|nr:hypothetical protein [Burkholderiales bacterium]